MVKKIHALPWLHPTKHPVRVWRHKNNVTLKELAKKLDVSLAYLSNIETRKTIPTAVVINGLAAITKIPSAELLKEYA